MDFLDPVQHRKHITRLFIGYVLIAIAVLLAATLLLMIAFGFGLSRNGTVIQKGLVFVSSAPNGADVYLDGLARNKRTNTRFDLPEGSYELQLKRDGYRTWQRHINVRGGSLVRYNYPVLFPETLTTNDVKTYKTKQPGMGTVTPDHRWLLVQQQPSLPVFDVFDLKNPTQAPTQLTIPASLYAAGGPQRWHPVMWADDNKHVLLRHTYGERREFILLDRTQPDASVNLSAEFETSPTSVKLVDSKYDKYYLYDATDKTVKTASLNDPAPQPLLEGVLTYDAYRDKTIVYATDSKAQDGAKTTLIRLYQDGKTYTIRKFAGGGTYQVAVSSYDGKLYVAAAARNDIAYLYRDPIAQLSDKSPGVISPAVRLRVKNASYLSFSHGSQLFVAENGRQFASYDLEYKQSFKFTQTPPIDKGQAHAVWMDGAHLQYVSNGQLYVFDYDGSNAQLLMPARSNDAVFYSNQQRVVYALLPQAEAAVTRLTSTPLRTPADQ